MVEGSGVPGLFNALFSALSAVLRGQEGGPA